MEFLYGLAGSLVAIGLLVAGFFMGWKAQEHLAKPREQIGTAPELSAEEKQRLREQQEAFQQLLDYNAEKAYQSDADKEERSK